MALQHKVLPNSLGVKQPNPALDNQSAVYINTTNRPWIKPLGESRKASLSSFGFGGSNFHATVEEYIPPQTNQPKKYPNTNLGGLFLISSDTAAATKTALTALGKQLVEHSLVLTARNSQLSFKHGDVYKCGFFATDSNSAEQQIQRLINYPAAS